MLAAGQAYLSRLHCMVGQVASQPRMLPSLPRLYTRDPMGAMATTLALWPCQSCTGQLPDPRPMPALMGSQLKQCQTQQTPLELFELQRAPTTTLTDTQHCTQSRYMGQHE